MTKVSMSHVKAVHRFMVAESGAGVDWFAPSASRFFSTTYPRAARGYGQGYLFVTGDADRYGGGDRRYSVRHQSPDGTVSTVGDFQAYATRREADAVVAAMLAAHKTPA